MAFSLPSSSTNAILEPTTRSRTLLFRSYRESRPLRTRRPRGGFNGSVYGDEEGGIGEDERRGLMAVEEGQTIFRASVDGEEEGLPPKWVDISEHVEEILADTKAKITALDKLHGKHVLPGFSDRTNEEREIEAATTDITKNFRQCQTLIQKVGTVASHTFPPSPRNETLAAKNVQRGLAAKVQEMSATFRKKQRVYMEKLQGHAIKNQDLLIASGTISPPLKGSEGLSAVDDDVRAATASRANQTSLLQEDALAPEVRQRDRELTEIANSIAQLADLFKDLSNLVIDQGTLLDSVEYNIEQTAVQVREAAKELNVAQRYQKNTGRRKCIFLLLLIIFGFILVLIFKPRRHSSPPPPPPAPSSDSDSSSERTFTPPPIRFARDAMF